MGLVDYSDSESDSEIVTKPTPAPAASSQSGIASGKKSFQKVVDRANPGKIRVNLPQNLSDRDANKAADDGNEQPATRARMTGKGGGAFGGFNSLLPPPKNAGKPAVASTSGKAAPKIGVNLKTGATPGFSREPDGETNADDPATGADHRTNQPSIPAEQKPAEEVKLVGKPLMFKPLSVSRKPGKKGATKSTTKPSTAPAAPAPQMNEASEPEAEEAGPPAKKLKMSLFTISDDGPYGDVVFGTSHSLSAQPIDEIPTEAQDDDDDDAETYGVRYPVPSAAAPDLAFDEPTEPRTESQSLDDMANSMNLSAAERRELFGRGGNTSQSGANIITFDTSREYEHNERLRASGELEQSAYNPVRSQVAAGGKTNLRQLVNQVHNNRDALEESFAKGRSNQNDARSRYGW
ncbi:hypothetical protein M426DRAFT_316664 [Hypoxylon sp. CI-4A]|nr:hypothetical protein M426DRAFT_316664 [Hypoxylon sp. CI-4A]